MREGKIPFNLECILEFAREHLGVEMERTVPVCSYSAQNNQCIGKRCPFSAAGHKKPTVAFLCVHNSCRSQIAEALGKQLAGDVFDSVSAGTEPGPRINPDAVRLMKQVYGIDMEQTQYNKPLDQLPDEVGDERGDAAGEAQQLVEAGHGERLPEVQAVHLR